MSLHTISTAENGEIWRATLELAFISVGTSGPTLGLHRKWTSLYGDKEEWRPVPTLNAADVKIAA